MGESFFFFNFSDTLPKGESLRVFLYSPKEFKLNLSVRLRLSRFLEQKYLVDRQ